MQKLAKIMEELKKIGVETEDTQYMERDIKDRKTNGLAKSFVRYIYVVDNRQFKVVYEYDSGELKFETTGSNQTITDDYMKQIIAINEALPRIKEAIMEVI